MTSEHESAIALLDADSVIDPQKLDCRTGFWCFSTQHGAAPKKMLVPIVFAWVEFSDALENKVGGCALRKA